MSQNSDFDQSLITVPDAPRRLPRRLIIAVSILAAIILAVVLVTTQMAKPSTPVLPSFTPSTIPRTSMLIPQLDWHAVYGGSGDDVFNAVTSTADGNIVVAGATDSPDGDFPGLYGGGDALVAMVDAKGVLLWAKTFGGPGPDAFHSVAVGSDGSIYAAGETASLGGDILSSRGSDALIVKLSPGGDVLWTKAFGGSGDDVFNCVLGAGNGVVVAGQTSSADGSLPATHGNSDALLAGIGADGTLTWAEALGGTGDDSFTSATLAQDGGIVAVGWSDSRDGDFSDPRAGSNAVIAGFGPNGQPIWYNVFGGSGDDEFNAITTRADGTFLVGGSSNSQDGDMPAALNPLRRVGIFGVLTTDRSQASFGRQVDNSSITFTAAAVTESGALANMMKMSCHNADGQGVPCAMFVLTDLTYPDTEMIDLTDDGGFLGASALADNKLAVVGYSSGDSAIYPGTKGGRDAFLMVYQIF